ncbi:hypothetical protein Xoosp13_67 [Xanthomonas phage Xoo-sp13]|nr:hypothetical protein Xoosp13_67 [Xanthomonas phage Xoo-sp13]
MSDNTLAARKEGLNNTLRTLKNYDIDNDSNYKFMNLLRSRLLEEQIPVAVATQIIANLDYDLSAVNEDDDYIGDVALAYAEFASAVYVKLESTGWHRNLTDSMIRKYFGHYRIQL